MATKGKQTTRALTSEVLTARVLCDFRFGNHVLYVGDLVQGPADLLKPFKDSIDTHEDAVAYAQETGATLKTVEVDDVESN